MATYCLNKNSREYKIALKELGDEISVQRFASMFPEYELPTGRELYRSLKIYTAINNNYQEVLDKNLKELNDRLIKEYNVNPAIIEEGLNVFSEIMKMRQKQGELTNIDIKYALKAALNHVSLNDPAISAVDMGPETSRHFSMLFNNLVLSYFGIEEIAKKQAEETELKEVLSENAEEEVNNEKDEEEITSEEFGSKLFDADPTVEFGKKVTQAFKNIPGLAFRDAEKIFIDFVHSNLFDPKYPYKSLNNIQNPLLREKLLQYPHHFITSLAQYYRSLRPLLSYKLVNNGKTFFFITENKATKTKEYKKYLENAIFKKTKEIDNEEKYKEIANNAATNLPLIKKELIAATKTKEFKKFASIIKSEIQLLNKREKTKYLSLNDLIAKEGNNDVLRAIELAKLLDEGQKFYISELTGIDVDLLTPFFNKRNNEALLRTIKNRSNNAKAYFENANEFSMLMSVIIYPGMFENNTKNLNSAAFFFLALKRNEDVILRKTREEFYEQFKDQIVDGKKFNIITQIAVALSEKDSFEYTWLYRNAKGNKTPTYNLISSLQLQTEKYLNDIEIVDNKKFKKNDFVQINKFKPQEKVIYRIGGATNFIDNKGLDSGKMRFSEFLASMILGFVNPPHNAVSNGQYLGPIEIFSDKKPIFFTVLKKYTKQQAIKKIEEYGIQILDEKSNYIKYWDDVIKKIHKNISFLIKEKAINSVIEGTRINTIQFVEEFVLNYVANKLQTDEFYNNSGKDFGDDYVKMVKRSFVSPMLTFNTDIEGGIGKTMKHLTIPDPMYTVAKVIEEQTGVKLEESEGADGFQIVTEEYNEKFKVSSGSVFDVSGNMKLFYNNFHPLKEQRKMLKSNTILLTLNEAKKSPLLMDIYELMTKNDVGILSFKSSAKVNDKSLNNTDVVTYEKDENGNLRLKITGELKYDTLDNDFIGFLNDLRQEAVLREGKIPQQAIRRWISLPGGDKIVEKIKDVVSENYSELLNNILNVDKKNKEKEQNNELNEEKIKKYILKHIDKDDPTNKTFIKLLEHKNTRISDPKVINQVNNFISNIIRKKLLEIKGLKSVPTEKPNINQDLRSVEIRGEVATAAEIRISEEYRITGALTVAEEFPELVINEKGDIIDINIVNYALRKAYEHLQSNPTNKGKDDAVDIAISVMKSLEGNYPEDKIRKGNIRKFIANKISYALKSGKELNEELFEKDLWVRPRHSYTVIVRVPVTGDHSITYCKIVGFIPKGPKSGLIETDLTTAKIAGADNDGDGRHMIFRSSGASKKDDLLDTIMDVVQDNYSKASMMKKLLDPINPDMTANKLKLNEIKVEKNPYDRLNPVKAIEALQNNRSGKDNIGIAANFLHFANYAIKYKLSLFAPLKFSLPSKKIFKGQNLYKESLDENIELERNLANVANECVDNANRQMLEKLGLDVSNNVMYNFLLLLGLDLSPDLPKIMNSTVFRFYRNFYLISQNPTIISENYVTAYKKTERYFYEQYNNYLKTQKNTNTQSLNDDIKISYQEFIDYLNKIDLPKSKDYESSNIESQLKVLKLLKFLFEYQSRINEIINILKHNDEPIKNYESYKYLSEFFKELKSRLKETKKYVRKKEKYDDDDINVRSINIDNLIKSDILSRFKTQIDFANKIYSTHILETPQGKEIVRFFKSAKKLAFKNELLQLSTDDYIKIVRAINNRITDRVKDSLPSYNESISIIKDVFENIPQEHNFRKYFILEESIQHPNGFFKLKEEYALRPLEEIEQQELEKAIKDLEELYPNIENNLFAIQLEQFGQTLSTKVGGYLKYLPKAVFELSEEYNKTYELFNNKNADTKKILLKLVLSNLDILPVINKNDYEIKNGKIEFINNPVYLRPEYLLFESKIRKGYSLLPYVEKEIIEKGKKYIEEYYDKSQRIDLDENRKIISKKDLDIKYQEYKSSDLGFINEDTELYSYVKTTLSSIYPNIEVFTNKEKFLTYINKHFNKNGKIDINKVGAAFGNAIYINENKATQDTLFHEYAHIYWDALPENEKIKERLLKLFNNNEEKVIQAIGVAGTDILNVKLKGNKLSQFKGLLQLFWAKVKNIFGIANAKDLIRIFANRMLDKRNKVKINSNGEIKYQTQKTTKKQKETINNLIARTTPVEFDEETHTYSIENVPNVLNSVTTLIGLHKGFSFDEELTPEKEIIDRKLFDFAKYYLSGLSQEQALINAGLNPKDLDVKNRIKLKKKGAIAATLGTSFHKMVETILNGYTKEQTAKEKEVSFLPVDTFEKLYEQALIVAEKVSNEGAVLPELKIASPNTFMAGTIDLPVILPNGKVKIYDIKTSEDSTLSANYIEKKGIKESKKRKHGVQLAIYSEMLSTDEPNMGPGVEVDSYEIIPLRYKINDNVIEEVELEPNVTFNNKEILENYNTAKDIIDRNIKTSISSIASVLETSKLNEASFYRHYYKENNIDSNYEKDRKRYNELVQKKKNKSITEEEETERKKLFRRLNKAIEAYEDYLYEVDEIKEAFKNIDIESLTMKELKEKLALLSKYDPLASGLLLPTLYKALAVKVEQNFLDEIGRELPEDFNEEDINWVKAKIGTYQKSLSNNPMAQAVVTKATDAIDEAHRKSMYYQDKLFRLAKKLYKEKYGRLERVKELVKRTFWKYDDSELYSYMFDPKTNDMYKAEQEHWTQTQKEFYREVIKWQNKAKPVLEKYHKQYDKDYPTRIYIAKAMPEFQEMWKQSNLFQAFVYKLGKQYTVEHVHIKFNDPISKKEEIITYGEAIVRLEKYYNKNLLTKIRAIYLLRKYRNQAENYMRQDVPRDAANKLIKITNTYHTYAIENGTMVVRPMSDPSGHVLDSDYGVLTQHFVRVPKNFKNTVNVLAATSQLIDDIIYHEEMKDVMPEFLAVQSYYQQLGGFKNLSKYLEEEFLFRILKKKDTTLPPALDQSIKALNWLATQASLGYNFSASFINLTAGIIYDVIEEPKAYAKALFIQAYDLTKNAAYPFLWAAQKLNMISERENPLLWKKINALARNYGVFEARPYRRRAHGTAITLNPMVLTQMVEYWNQVSLFAAKLPKELLDLYDNNGNFKPGLSKQQKDNARKQMQIIIDDIQNAHGRYKESKMRHIQFYTLGKTLTQFKLWMFEYFEYRFGKEVIDNRGRIIMGTYRAAIRQTKSGVLIATREAALALHFNEIARNIEKILEKRNRYTEKQLKRLGFTDAEAKKYLDPNTSFEEKQKLAKAKNLKSPEAVYAQKAFVELMIASALFLYVMKADAEDDKDENSVYKWLKKRFIKLFGDFTFAFNPKNWKNILSLPIPSLGYLIKVADALSSIVTMEKGELELDRYQRTGKYGKGPSRKGANDGDLKIWGKLLMLAPYNSPVREIIDLSEEEKPKKKRKGAKKKYY